MKKMPIYLCFIQHILWSLKDNGKAAIVVPTGFITAKTGIPKKIRKLIIEKNWLKGVISMPSNIFANTGTNVSVLFIDKTMANEDILLIDASNLGEKVKEGQYQKTILRDHEISLIEDTFINEDVVEEFSVKVSSEDIIDKDYSFLASQYFDIKIKFSKMTEEEFDNKLEEFKSDISELFINNKKIEDSITQSLELMTWK